MREPMFNAFRPDVIADAVRQPPLEQLYARARTRRLRWRAWSALVALTATVTFVPLAVRVAPGTDRPDEPVRAQKRVSDVFVVDPRTAVAIAASTACVVGFSVTTDGGATWTAFSAPDRAATDGRTVPNCTYVGIPYHVVDGRTLYVDVNRQRYVSVDAGATWQPLDPTPIRLDRLPSTLRPSRFECLGACLPGNGPQTIDPSGRLSTLALPPGVNLANQVWANPDGTLWAAGPLEDLRGSTVSVTTDGGATWRTADIPDRHVLSGASGSGTTAYMVVGRRAGATSPPSPSVTVWATTDGSTWVERPLPAFVTAQPTAMLQTMVAPDGALVIAGATPGQVLVTTDQGATYRANSIPGGPDAVLRARHGLLWASDGEQVYLTADGRTWQSMPLPA